MRAAIAVLLLVGGCALPVAAQEGGDAPLYAGRPLVEVLQDLNRRGLRIVFSTTLVPPTLRVSSEPAGTPRDILDQLLRPHGLYARSGAQGVLIVARAPRRRDEAAPAPPARPPARSEPPAPTAGVSGQVLEEPGAPSHEVSVVVTDDAPIVDVQNATVGTNFA